MTKKELIEEVLYAIRDDMRDNELLEYDDVLFELAKAGLKKWKIKKLKDFVENDEERKMGGG